MSEWFILIIPNILIIHVQLNHSKIILFIRIISIFAIIFIIHLRSSALTGSSQDSCVDKICWSWKINTHTYTYDFRPSLTLQNRFSIQTMSPCAGSSKAQASHTQAPAKHKLLSKAHALLALWFCEYHTSWTWNVLFTAARNPWKPGFWCWISSKLPLIGDFVQGRVLLESLLLWIQVSERLPFYVVDMFYWSTWTWIAWIADGRDLW